MLPISHQKLSYPKLQMQDITEMDFPRLEDTVNKPNWCYNQPCDIDVHQGWKKLCATDCNGNIQNVGNPSKTCGCYLNCASSHRHPEGKKVNKGEIKKSKDSCFHPSSIFEDVLFKVNTNKFNSAFDKSNTFLSKEIITLKEKNIKFVNSELSYFSEKNSNDFGLSKVVEKNSEDCNPKKFTLFPEKSSSSPSILDGLNSYFKKNTPPRSRCVSDPQSKLQSPFSTEKCKEDSPDSGFNDRDSSPDFVTSRISSLKSKIDELELEYRIKDETINENSKLPNFLNEKHCHGANEKASSQQEKTIVGESFTPLFSLIPKRLFDSCSLQGKPSVITPVESKFVYRRNENDSCHLKINNPNSADIGKGKTKLVIPYKNASDFYPFQPPTYHSTYPPMSRQAIYCGVDPAGISHEWLDFIKKFQSFSARKDENLYRPENNASEVQTGGKKNYKKNNQNQQSAMECKFCKSNMESPKMYKSHNLKQRIGRRTLVTCPVLRKLVCERCGETGDNAHTLSYCPRVIAESGKKPMSVAAQLKKTKRVASGRMRKPF